LKNVVVFHVDLDFREYFDVLAEMDVCIPAFGPSDVYYVIQASATLTRVWKSTYVIFIGLRVHAEVRLIQVPLLATQRLRKAYTYADDDRVTLTYPAVMAEIDAIKALRTRNASDFLASDPSGSGLPLGSNLAVSRRSGANDDERLGSNKMGIR